MSAFKNPVDLLDESLRALKELRRDLVWAAAWFAATDIADEPTEDQDLDEVIDQFPQSYADFREALNEIGLAASGLRHVAESWGVSCPCCEHS